MRIPSVEHLRFGPPGLQRRIMLYAAVGLAMLSAAWGVVSARGIDTISNLLLEERLVAAKSIAAVISLDLSHVSSDVKEKLEPLAGNPPPALRARILADAIHHLRNTDDFRFFRPSVIIVVDGQGQLLMAAPRRAEPGAAELRALFNRVGQPAETGIYSSPPGYSESDSFAIIAIPLDRTAFGKPATAYVLTEGINSADPLPGFIPGQQASGSADQEAKYRLEVIDGEGKVALNIGSADPIGGVSAHWGLTKPVIDARNGKPGVNRDAAEPGRSAHVMAAVPIPDTDFSLVLEQENDRALAVPSKIRFQFIMIGIVGFAGALLVAWVTSRRVVRPTLQLAAAADRMARGDLSSPVDVRAQDEIASLSENVETMRSRLARALDDLGEANRDLERRVQDRTERLSRALRQVISAQEGERQRVARDLHDDVAQQLIVLTRAIDSLRRSGRDRGRPVAAQVDHIGEIARASLGAIRRVSRDLRPSVLDDLGLVPALSWIASEAGSRSGVQITVEPHTDADGITPEAALALFRITQEAVYNIERHARASRVRIGLDRADGTITLTVEDDGRGFAARSRWRDLAASGSLGLLGMNERAELVGGRLEIWSAKGKGTRVTARVPLHSLEEPPSEDASAPTPPA